MSNKQNKVNGEAREGALGYKQAKLKAEKSDLWKLRHTAEHVLHQAVKELYPSIQLAMGPATEDGFYFDFDGGEVKISAEDFPKIEAKMQEIIDLDLPMIEKEITVGAARELFAGNPYKLEWVDTIETKGEMVTIYWSGEPGSQRATVDLCAGPHVASTGQVKAFKLLSVAGAYWHGDEKNKMLTRIYGTAFFSQKELDKHLEMLAEAEKRNHHRIGKQMELFEIFPEIGQGLPVWLPKGYAMRRAIEDYMIWLERKYGYAHILTPHINRNVLFKKSGHLDFYADSMYPPIEFDDEKYYLKPMNCPAGMMVYKRKPRSYKDLPLKLGELGTVYRYEKSGELHGLQRVRGMTQNDAHIFCTAAQLKDQFREVMEMLDIFYKDVGFDKYTFRLSLSDPKDDKYSFCGSRKDWEKMENTMREILDEAGVEYESIVGDAAFYGPKLDVQAVNVFGKEDSISTIQVDFNLPERFELEYVNSDGQKERPFVIHRALVGSFERFFAFLIEHHAGKFPLWYAPVQVKLLPITDRNVTYAQKIVAQLLDKNIRVELDDRSETLSAKIRDAQLEQVPYMAVVGDKEMQDDLVAVRARDGQKQEVMGVLEFVEKLQIEVQKRK
ncbi:threonine--tRNA ligase [Patescibacteria group bacterium]|nr:threonine--tRNA ligase [Patescibacteria group bacterium]MBU1885817.1 threonine--tRNA ligase [Patescibacteria group bacterium]